MAIATRAIAVTASVLFLAASAGAGEIWSRGEFSVDLGGSVREFAAGTRGTSREDFQSAIDENPSLCTPAKQFPDCPAFDEVGEANVFTSLTRLRLRLDLQATQYVSAVITYDNELLAGTLDTTDRQLSEEFSRDPWLDISGTIDSGEHHEWRHSLYRGFIRLQTEHFEATVGRQRIPWGVGRLWNPIDRFNAVPPLAIQADQSPGVDAVDARWLISGFTHLEGVYAEARNHNDDSYAMRLHGMFRNVDYSLMGGVFEDAPAVGVDIAGNLRDAAGRAEVVWTRPKREVWLMGEPGPERLDSFWQVVVSIDYSFDVGTGLYGLVEYLYNGNALGFGCCKAGALLPFFEQELSPEFPNDPVVKQTTADRFGGSRVVTRSRHLTGFQFGYDLTPEIRSDTLAIVDWDGLSAVFYPRVLWTPLDFLEVSVGLQVPVGPRESEYGGLYVLGFVLIDVFF